MMLQEALLRTSAGSKVGTSDGVNYAFWSLVWPRIKDERITVTVWMFRPSVRVAALRPLFERIFGAPPVEP